MEAYRIYGVELSPYSVKVRSWFRYKGIAHEWIIRDRSNAATFAKYAKLPLIPLVLAPGGEAMQDSTPLIETLEAKYPEPSIIPPDPRAAFISALLEEYADEWGNKHMFHYRWACEADQNSAAQRIAELQLPPAFWARLPGVRHFLAGRIAAMIRKRMIPRRSFVGSSDATAGQIEASFKRLCRLLEAHLADRPYVFGGRPALADFGLWGQIYNAWTDPTPRKIIETQTPGLLPWIKRMIKPEQEGDWENWEALAPGLSPILAQEVAALFLPWTQANAKALAAGQAQFEVELEGSPFRQNTQKYHARSLKVLRGRYAEAAEKNLLDPILDETGCLAGLKQ